jgi:signal transduction histidine kinase
VIIYDTEFEILKINKAAEEMFGINFKELKGKKITPQMIKTPRFTSLVQILFPSLAPAATELSSDSWPQVVRIETNNPPLKLYTTLNRLNDERGKTAGFVKIVRDETRESEMVESKGEFVSVAAHNLRTPLTALNWSLEALAEDVKDNPEAREKIKNAGEIVERMIKTVNDLLDIAKIEEGKFGYEFKNIELSEFLSQIVAHVKPIAEEYGVSVRFDGSDKKYGARIDPNRFGIVVTNLLDNAIRYNVKGGEVAVSLEDAREKKGFIKIKIADTGIGIPEEERGKIFEKFYRSPNAIHAQPNGTGLGLYITKNIVERHGGEINIESALGRGTTFSIFVPSKN